MPIINKRLKKKLSAKERSDPIFKGISDMSDASLDEYLVEEWERAQALDGKLAKLTTTLSVGLTIGGVASQFIVDQLDAFPIKWTFAFFVLIAMLFLLIGAIIGFNGLRPKARYAYGPKFRNDIELGGQPARTAKELAAEGFLIMNIMRNNEASAAIDLIRNGIIFYGLALLLLLPISMLDTSNQAPTSSNHSLNIAIEISAEHSTDTLGKPLVEKALEQDETVVAEPSQDE